MKKMLVAATLAIALVASSRAATRAGDYNYGLGLGLNLNYAAALQMFNKDPNKCDKAPGDWGCQNGRCGPGGCLPPPNWSPCYPQPQMYGGYYAMNPCHAQNNNYGTGLGYHFPGNSGVLHPGYNGMAQMPMQMPTQMPTQTLPPPIANTQPLPLQAKPLPAGVPAPSRTTTAAVTVSSE